MSLLWVSLNWQRSLRYSHAARWHACLHFSPYVILEAFQSFQKFSDIKGTNSGLPPCVSFGQFSACIFRIVSCICNISTSFFWFATDNRTKCAVNLAYLVTSSWWRISSYDLHFQNICFSLLTDSITCCLREGSNLCSKNINLHHLAFSIWNKMPWLHCCCYIVI